MGPGAAFNKSHTCHTASHAANLAQDIQVPRTHPRLVSTYTVLGAALCSVAACDSAPPASAQHACERRILGQRRQRRQRRQTLLQNRTPPVTHTFPTASPCSALSASRLLHGPPQPASTSHLTLNHHHPTLPLFPPSGHYRQATRRARTKLRLNLFHHRIPLAARHPRDILHANQLKMDLQLLLIARQASSAPL